MKKRGFEKDSILISKFASKRAEYEEYVKQENIQKEAERLEEQKAKEAEEKRLS